MLRDPAKFVHDEESISTALRGVLGAGLCSGTDMSDGLEAEILTASERTPFFPLISATAKSSSSESSSFLKVTCLRRLAAAAGEDGGIGASLIWMSSSSIGAPYSSSEISNVPIGGGELGISGLTSS